MIYALIGCLIIIGFLGIKLFQKQKLDRDAIEKLNIEYKELQDKLISEQHEYEDIFRKTQEENLQYFNIKQKSEFEKQRLEEYQDLINNKFADIDDSIEEQRQKRQEELDKQFEDKTALYQKDLQNIKNSWEEETTRLAESLKLIQEEYQSKTNKERIRFEGIERVLRTYDAEQQAKFFYTIQLPEEYYEDIEFLLTTVAAKVAHPDIISKLVWTEYVKPNLENTFKRIEIKSEPGIYKLTSLENGKCYVGKSTDVKRRITDHFKSVVGITSIADQAVHHAIRKEGFWNWTIEIITYCDKEQLPELEKYYIEFFKSQEFGYNRNAGG